MIYDLIIIGAGPAGITASIYASRYKINHLVIGEIPGGLITEAHSVCNFPGEDKITGFDLMEKFQNHAKNLGADILSMEKVVKITKKENLFLLKTESQKEFKSKTILLATGTKYRKIGLENEDSYIGKGLAYCATCDAMFFKEKEVAVVGGGNSALTAALHLSKIAKKVNLLVRGDKFNGEVAWIDQVKSNDKIEILFNTEVSSLHGENILESINIVKDKKEENLRVDGVFIEIGTDPNNFLSDQLKIKTDKGYLIVDSEQKTSVEGAWSAGDITTNSNFFRQVITACSEGAVAVFSIFSYLQKNKK
jgi:thioredoxin reductase (NADPH)